MKAYSQRFTNQPLGKTYHHRTRWTQTVPITDEKVPNENEIRARSIYRLFFFYLFSLVKVGQIITEYKRYLKRTLFDC